MERCLDISAFIIFIFSIYWCYWPSLLFLLLRFWQVIDPLAIALGFASVEPWATFFECCKSKRASWHVKYGEKNRYTIWIRMTCINIDIFYSVFNAKSLKPRCEFAKEALKCSVKLVFCWEAAWQSGSGGSLLGWTFASLPSCCDKGARKNRCSGAAQ